MRRSLGLVACLVLAWGASAQAASLPYDASLTLQIGSFPALEFLGSGVGTSDGGPGSNASTAAGLPVGALAALASPLAGLIEGFAICTPGLPANTVLPLPARGTSVSSCDPEADGSLDAISFDGASGMGSGSLAASAYLVGIVFFRTVAEIPLEVIGVGGTDFFDIPSLSVRDATITGNPWTTGTASVTYQLLSDPAPQTLTAQGSDGRNADGTGQLTLVTSALANLGSFTGTVGAIAELRINYVPEPGTLGLVGLGLIGLVTASRRRE